MGFHTTRLPEWTEVLTNCATDSEIYAVALFLNTLSIPTSNWPPCLTLFINKHLLFLGHSSLSADRLAYAFNRERGFKWYLIRSIIAIDRTPLTDYPLIQIEFLGETYAAQLIQDFLHRTGLTMTKETWNACFFDHNFYFYSAFCPQYSSPGFSTSSIHSN
jgi:hypothetical protein